MAKETRGGDATELAAETAALRSAGVLAGEFRQRPAASPGGSIVKMHSRNRSLAAERDSLSEQVRILGDIVVKLDG